MEARISNVNSVSEWSNPGRVRCSVRHVFIKGSSYTLAIMARTRREYLGEKPRILAELTLNGELKCLRECLPLKKAREDIEISLLRNSVLMHAIGYSYVANYCYIFCSGYARSLLVL